jgi:beta-lactamase class A
LARTIAESGPQTHSIRELTSLIIRVSDNTASDSLLRNVGGPRAVARTLRELGVTGVNVDRYELEFAADYYGIRGLGRMKSFSLERFIGAVERLSPERRRTSAARFLSDRRDSATPASMARLLGRLVTGELLNPEHSKWLLDEMSEMHARDTRLRAGFPAGTRASVRPGTSGETDGVRAAQNDCAIVQLPGNRGHLVIAAFLKGSRGPDAARDAALAAVGRAAFEWAILRSAAVRKVPDRERVTRP